MTRVLSLRVSDELAARVDRAAADAGVRRAEWLERAVESALRAGVGDVSGVGVPVSVARVRLRTVDGG